MWGHAIAFERGWNLLKQQENYDHDLSMDDRIARLNVLETYAGGGGNPNLPAGWSQAARDRGHNVLTNEIMYAGNPMKDYDVDLGYMPDFAGDIRNFTAEDIIRRFGGKTPDLFCASPPCEGHSISARMAGWEDWKDEQEKKDAFNRARNAGDWAFFDDPSVGPTPANEQAHLGRSLMNYTWDLVDGLQDYRTHHEGRDTDDPMYYMVENPTGMMRYQPEMAVRPMIQPAGVRRRGKQAPSSSVTHSSYSGPWAEHLGFARHDIPGHPSLPSRKPTDLWSNMGDIFTPREHTKVGLHENAPELNMSLEDLRAKFGNRVEEVPLAPKKPGHAGVYHAWAPRGARSGTQSIGSFTMPDGTIMPKYQMRSLIPYGLGLDTIMAVERALRGEPQPGNLF